MTWHDTKQAAVDPDNPAANEQIPFSEWNNMVSYLKDKINNKTVDLTGLADDYIMVYDLAHDKFVFEAKTTTAALNDLTDVVISGVPAEGEVLAYTKVGVNPNKFINQTAAEAGLATVAGLAALETAVVLNADYNATTFLYATSDDTPQPKTPAEVMAILSGKAGAEFLFNTQKIGGIVDPTTPQQAATKNYDDTMLYGKSILAGGPWTTGHVLAYNATSGKFEMVAQSGGGGGVTDHGALTGLADDDHTQYMLADGSRDITGTLTLNKSSPTIALEQLGVVQATFRYALPDDMVWLTMYDQGGAHRVAFELYAGATIFDVSSLSVLGNVDMTGDLTINKTSPSINLEEGGVVQGFLKYYLPDDVVALTAYDFGTLDLVDFKLTAGATTFDVAGLSVLGNVDMNSKNITSSGNITSGTHSTYDIGTNTNRWANIYATNTVTGDLVFEEKACHICKKPFAEGEILSLIAIKLSKKGTHTVPVHSSCIGGNN